MMHYASPGVRNAARKGSNVLVHGHRGPTGGASDGHVSRSIHLSGILNSLHPPHASFGPTLESIRPRNPSHKLFSASKNILQRFFTHLTAPGLRAPAHYSAVPRAGARSLHNTVRGSTIQSSLSLPARHALRTNALQRQTNTFLPRAPNPAPPRFGGVTQVGLGTARNFSSARPIFQHLADNIPVAGRALYEIDWDIEMRKEHERMRFLARNEGKKAERTKEMIRPVQESLKSQPLVESNDNVSTEDMDHYFPTRPIAPVTTYLLIPLAPTPTSRAPLPSNPTSLPSSAGWQPTLLPLSYLGEVHSSHSTHALRVSTLFTRLDQANMWARGGVYCSAYSQGQAHRRRGSKTDGVITDEGVCTILRVEFVGWTKAEVRGVIGESGSGWCILEEVDQEEEDLTEDDTMSDMDSLSSGLFDEQAAFNIPCENEVDADNSVNLSQSFILPTIDLSSTWSSSMSRSGSLSSIPSEMQNDPWVDDHSSSSGSSSYSDLADLIIDPPSVNGWFDAEPLFGQGVRPPYRPVHHDEDVEPQEGMFY